MKRPSLNQEERGFSRLVTVGVTGIVALLALNAALAYRHLTTIQQNALRVAQSQEMLAKIGALQQLLIDAETGYRGYLITGDAAFLAPHQRAVERFPGRLAELQQLTREDAAQSERLAALETPMREALANMDAGLALYRAEGFGAARDRVATGAGRRRMDGIRREVGTMIEAELQSLAERRRQSRRALTIGLAANFLGAALGLTAVIAFVWQLDRAMRAQRRSAAAIHEQRQLLHATLTSIGDAVLATDAEGRVTFLNGVAEQLTGWRQEEARGVPLETVFQIVNEETREKVENPALRALREGAIVGLANHTILISKEGSERPIDDSAAPIWNERGELGGAVLVFRDITDRKQVEQDAKEQLRFARLNAEIGDALTSRGSFSEVLQACADSLCRNLDGALVRIWILDPPGKRLRPSATSGDAPPPPWLAAGPLEEGGVGQGWVGRVARQPTVQLLDALAEEKNEEVRQWARQQGIQGAAGCPLIVQERLIGVVALFSRRPLGEKALNIVETAAGSMALGIERSAMEDKLRQYVADLSDADRRKDEFLATLAHELRNPLAPLRNGLQLIRLTGALSGDAEATRAMMERQIEQMVRLVDDLMDVSRITRGKLELRRERVLLGDVVSSAVETARPLIEEMGHHLTLSLPAQPIPLHADRVRLAQVFSNLLTNSAKYMERGGKIWLTADQEGDQVVVRVKDQGIGISEEHLPQIFQMFSQLDRSLHKAQGGLGIGLSLVKRLTEMHGGDIEAQSEGAGKGAEFVVRLPILSESVAAASTREEAPQLLKSSLRILVVDDNRDGADSLCLMLRLMGNETHAAYDGEEGVRRAEELRPDLVLLDIGLPKLNGYEACARIRQQPWGKELLLIAITGWGQDEDRRRSQEAGFDYHLVKPVDPLAFSKLLAELSKGARPGGSAPPV